MTNQTDFLREVAGHQLQIIKDDGVYRHLRFKRPNTSCCYFDVVTWPGVLCYTGDMGTYVFSRITDMFEFFRREPTEEGGLLINPGYWSEKLLAVDGGRHNAAAMEFSEEKFKQVIADYVEEWLANRKVSEEDAEALREAVKEDIFDNIEPSDENYSYRLGDDFRYVVGDEEFYIQDLWDYNFRTYTHRFLWCCYALNWGIAKYDEVKQS